MSVLCGEHSITSYSFFLIAPQLWLPSLPPSLAQGRSIYGMDGGNKEQAPSNAQLKVPQEGKLF